MQSFKKQKIWSKRIKAERTCDMTLFPSNQKPCLWYGASGCPIRFASGSSQIFLRLTQIIIRNPKTFH